MNRHRVVFWAITSSLAGFLFGFDTAVISGAEQSIQSMWSLSDVAVGQMVAMALYGTIIGALVGGIPAQRLGRKTTLLWIAVCYLVAAMGSALAPEVYSLMTFRFIGGLSVGASSVVAPMYIAEIAPPASRGRLTAMFQFNIVFGILLAYLSNFLIGPDVENSWRWMLGVQVVPSILFLTLLFYVPESPRWLVVARGKLDEARAILAAIDPAQADVILQAIRATDDHPGRAPGLGSFFSKQYRYPILLAFLFAFFNQASGINAIIYFAPRIFGLTGMGDEAALLSTVGIGVVNLAFTMIGLALIDRMGRRFLMYLGSIGYILSLSLISWFFFRGSFSGMSAPLLIFVFIAAHAVGQGAVIWVFISEIFPNVVRSYGNSLGSATHWIFAALIAGNFVWLEGAFGGGLIFAFFAAMMLMQLLFVWRLMPETKGVTLEEMERKLGIRTGGSSGRAAASIGA